MILFNAFLFIFSSPSFNIVDVQQGVNLTDTDIASGYKLDSTTFLTDFISSFVVILSLGGLASLYTKNSVYVGVSIVIGLLAGLWAAMSSSIGTMFQSYPLADNLYTVFVICLGVIAVIAISDIFSGRSTDD